MIVGYRYCTFCGKEVPIYHKKRLEYKNIFCNKECEAKYRKSLTELNCECEVCHKLFHKKQSHLDKCKHHYCSVECHAIAKKEYMKNEKNHQYGLKGDKNPTWKTDERISHYGYRLIRVLAHPFKNGDGFVFEHRLIAEKYLLNENNSIEIDGIKYLSKEYHVHHLDFDRLNNDVENLCVVNKTLHSKFHNSLNGFIRRNYKNECLKATDIFTKEELIKLFFEFIEYGKFVSIDTIDNEDFDEAKNYDFYTH